MNNNHQQILEFIKQLLQYMREHPEEVQRLTQLEKAQGTKTKFDRCVEHVSKQPNITNPYAVCVAAGVKPSRWKKSESSEQQSEEHPDEKQTKSQNIRIELMKPFTPRFYRSPKLTQKSYTCKAQSDPSNKPIMALRHIKPSDVKMHAAVWRISSKALGYKRNQHKKLKNLKQK